ncbi:MAG TPA: hypothetical protein VGS23_03995 [Thermoplasmata archaeon]|nr:hypothetical protein [Thermoplasmata archaeon]
MPTDPDLEVVATWYATFLVGDGRVLKESRFPEGAEGVLDRLRARREGRLSEEEAALVESSDAGRLVSRDRRFEPLGVRTSESRPPRPSIPGPSWGTLREVLLSEAEEALRAAWDPSIHLDEAVRTMADLDRVTNLLGERLASWASRDRPGLAEPNPESAERALEALLEGTEGLPLALPKGDPALLEARASLARSLRSFGGLRRELEAAVESAAARRMPNLASLLGPTLSARMVSQAGGLDRLARLPSSTVQVLGAEKAFFDHLRRGSRPPRHGLLFLHPSIQGAPRKARGRLARALAGKVSIAARLDQAGKPLNASLAESFQRRAEEIRPIGAKRGSRLPLDRAAEDR